MIHFLQKKALFTWLAHFFDLLSQFLGRVDHRIEASSLQFRRITPLVHLRRYVGVTDVMI